MNRAGQPNNGRCFPAQRRFISRDEEMISAGDRLFGATDTFKKYLFETF